MFFHTYFQALAYRLDGAKQPVILRSERNTYIYIYIKLLHFCQLAITTYMYMALPRKLLSFSFLCLEVFLEQVSAVENFDFNIETLQRGVRLQRHRVFKTFEPSLFPGCLKQCILRRRCKAFTFNAVNLTCDLGISVSIEENVHASYMTSEPSHWPQAEVCLS